MRLDKTRAAVCVATLLLLGACGEQKRATARLEPRSNSTASGDATFTEEDGEVQVRVTVEGLSPGRHGIHIHEYGDCSAPDSTSTGGHWNPAGQQHGGPDSPVHHLGDMGNIEVGADGRGTLVLTSEEWTVGDGATTDVAGHALVVHAEEDDLVSDPAGNSGARIGCGVITVEQ